MPMPPSQRNKMKVQMSLARAVPMAEVRKRAAARTSAFFRPNRSEMGDAAEDAVAGAQRQRADKADRAADQHATRRPALHPHREVESCRQELDGSGDNTRIVAEQQTAERGDEADGDKVGEVGAHCGGRS